ncbi:MAG: hypothetical protein HYW26_00905 [Candidatus Aenigmarchaeota archaeon]|nr:hypothetical protein [Candidatus Aenigmarchaeota archaeon]
MIFGFMESAPLKEVRQSRLNPPAVFRKKNEDCSGCVDVFDFSLNGSGAVFRTVTCGYHGEGLK